MSLDPTQLRHGALLHSLETPLKTQGWRTQIMPPTSHTPLHTLVCQREGDDTSAVYLSYTPLEDETNELELMEITCALPLTIPDPRQSGIMTLLHTLNTTLPLGAFCIQANTVSLRHVYAHHLNTFPSAHDVVKIVDMMAGVALVFVPTIQAVIEGQSPVEGDQVSTAEVPDTRTLLEQVTDYLERRGLSYDIAQDVAAIVLIQGRNGTFNLILQVREQERQVLAYSVGSLRTPPDQRSEMALFVTLANYGLIVGNFELDLNDGEVRYKVSQDLGTQPLTDEILNRLIQSSVRAYDPYAVGIRAVAEGQLNARAAIAQIEG